MMLRLKEGAKKNKKLNRKEKLIAIRKERMLAKNSKKR